ncbi:endonuclease III [Candidatus Woesearchaeota archaeon]|nr:endonuclease III [Candidatus Woesearchaeota archaeon]
MVTEKEIDKVMQILAEEYPKFRKPIVTEYSELRHDPFEVLISTILSLRTKDETTHTAWKRLSALANNPQNMVKLSAQEVEKAIYPVGFYITKAKTVIETCKLLLEKYDGKVPDDLDELLMIKGVGRKTANLVITLGFDKPGLCIDTHCNRFPNRLGWIKTKNAEDTEFVLRELLPQKYWKVFNDYVVAYGQNVCLPVSPRCSVCRIKNYCNKVGVEISR